MASNSVTTLVQLRSAIIRSKNLSADVASATADAIDELDQVKADSADLTSLANRVTSVENTLNSLVNADNNYY